MDAPSFDKISGVSTRHINHPSFTVVEHEMELQSRHLELSSIQPRAKYWANSKKKVTFKGSFRGSMRHLEMPSAYFVLT